ncbi:MAG: response regulator [Victivallales bacterium]|nr:response regulator [Victivallales bacterium]
MKDRLSELVEYFSVPAFVVCLKEGVVTASNSLALRTYGTGFMRGRKIKINALCEVMAPPVCVRITDKEPYVKLKECPRDDSKFYLVKLSDNVIIGYEAVFENADRVGTNSSLLRISELKREPVKPFHLNYVYYIASGKWMFSRPETLVELGITRDVEQLIKKGWRSVVHDEDLPLYDNTFNNAIRHGGSHEMHYRIKRGGKDGCYPVSDYCGIMCPDGKWPVLTGSIICNPLSDKNMFNAERQVLTGRLLGGMIHDFKNLLGGIRNVIEWSINISEDPKVVDALQKTLGYTDQATELIIGTLRLNTGEMDTKVEKINLAELVLGLEGLISRIIPSSTDLQIFAPESVPPIYGQKSLLQDMFLNLCVNARDALKGHDDVLEIVIETEHLQDDNGQEQEYLALSVRDNGCGMSKSEVKHIFDAFYSSKENGAGLGMWMVKNAVCSFDGRIEVDSEVGVGTVFKVLFPVVDNSERFIMDPGSLNRVKEDKICYADIISSDTNKTILYIEDNMLVSTSVRTWLESLGFRLLFADDGIKGKELFDAHQDRIDLVIQDYVLPGIKGDDLLAYFIGTRPDIPVIIVSAENDEDCTQRLFNLGACDMIRKPFKMEDLLRSLTRILNKS